MNRKLMVTLALLVALTLAIVGCSPANTANAGTPEPTPSTSPTDEPTIEPTPGETLPSYLSITGTVQSIAIQDNDGNGMDYSVSILHGEEAEAVFQFKDEQLLSEGTPKEGDSFTGWYDARLPMIMIYPPQYTAVAAYFGDLPEGQSLKVDEFDEALISSDGTLKPLTDGEISILTPTGQPYAGDLAGRLLAVFYGPSTRSIPAQTTPEKIIVLDAEDAAPQQDGALIDAPADAALYRGTVESITQENGVTTLSLKQAQGTDYGSDSLLATLDENTRTNFDIATLQAGQYIEIYYGADGTVPETAAAIVANRLHDAQSIVFNGKIVSIQQGEQDAITGLLMAAMDDPDNTVLFHISESTQIYDDTEKWEPGTQLNILLLNNAMTASLPPQTTAREIRPYAE